MKHFWWLRWIVGGLFFVGAYGGVPLMGGIWIAQGTHVQHIVPSMLLRQRDTRCADVIANRYVYHQ